VADVCDRVVVMYAGQVVETGSVRDVFHHPQHPYTEGLLRSMPQAAAPRSELRTIPGQVPAFSELGQGCRLAGRCEYVEEQCLAAPIELVRLGEGRAARCVRVVDRKLEPAEGVS
jgi:oligopeptide/dipeptide ABC transporter ATP-binding protein